MRFINRLSLVLIVTASVMTGPLVAQETPPQQNVITLLQGKGVLADEDNTALRAWIQQRVGAVAAENAVGTSTAIKELRESYQGTPAFQDSYATLCTEIIGGAYKQAPRSAATRLIAVLNTLLDARTSSVLIAALADERVPVRAAAAIGLRKLHAKLVAAGGTAYADSIRALRDAGKRESSVVVLKLLYAAMDFSGSPDAKADTAALLDLLESRSEQYASRTVKGAAGDSPGLVLAEKLSTQLDELGQRRLAIATAKMLHYAVIRYATEFNKTDDKTSSPLQIALRNRFELFIETAETLLAKLTAPPTTKDFCYHHHRNADPPQEERAIQMRIAMAAWATALKERFQLELQVEMPETNADTPATEP